MKKLTHEMKNGAAQGEILLIPVDVIPECSPASLVDDHYVVAHSETGHHHRILGRGVQCFQMDDFTQYIDVTAESATLEHLRSFDTHEPIKIGGGKYMIRTARESSPEGWKRVVD